MLYRHGKIEGGEFKLQWVSEILNTNIYIQSIESQKVSQSFYSTYTSSNILYLMHSPLSSSHVHFGPLLQKKPKGKDTCVQMQIDMHATKPILMLQHKNVDINNIIQCPTHMSYIARDKRHNIKKSTKK